MSCMQNCKQNETNLGRQKFNSPSRNTSPVQFQASSANYNQHIPQYAFPYPVYRYTIETYVKSNSIHRHFRSKACMCVMTGV